MPTPAGSVTSTWMACRPTHETECCSGNVHRLMPNSVTCMWLHGREGAIAAALYGPSAGEFDLPDGRIRLHLGMEPAGAWNYALCPETGCKPKVVRTQTAAQVGYPFDRESVPVKIRVPVKRIDWTLEESRYTPRLPEGGKARAISDDIEYLELIPYGCTELRLTVFPVVE